MRGGGAECDHVWGRLSQLKHDTSRKQKARAGRGRERRAGRGGAQNGAGNYRSERSRNRFGRTPRQRAAMAATTATAAAAEIHTGGGGSQRREVAVGRREKPKGADSEE